jgi:hypothetical protein
VLVAGLGSPESADQLARKLAGRFRLVNVAWVVLSVCLLVSFVGAVAAAWNIYVTTTRWRMAALIEARSPAVLDFYDRDAGWFLTAAIVNLALGGGIGAALVAYEYFFVRKPVLDNRHVFARSGR